jgi:ribosomal protein L22
VEEARNTLLFTKKRVASHVGKLLQSALDNANFLANGEGARCRDSTISM